MLLSLDTRRGAHAWRPPIVKTMRRHRRGRRRAGRRLAAHRAFLIETGQLAIARRATGAQRDARAACTRPCWSASPPPSALRSGIGRSPRRRRAPHRPPIPPPTISPAASDSGHRRLELRRPLPDALTILHQRVAPVGMLNPPRRTCLRIRAGAESPRRPKASPGVSSLISTSNGSSPTRCERMYATASLNFVLASSTSPVSTFTGLSSAPPTGKCVETARGSGHPPATHTGTRGPAAAVSAASPPHLGDSESPS